MKKYWHTSRRKIDYSEKTLIMAVLNATPDSFYDGGRYVSTDAALKQAEKMIEDGADIIDIGGESTRPQSERVSERDEIQRVVPVVKAISRRFDIPISVDTSKQSVAETSIDAGAEIINDVSGLKFDERIAETAARTGAGLILMHLRGEFETMHKQNPVKDILREVSEGFRDSINKALSFNVKRENIAIDVGIGFSKTFEQNLELIAWLETFIREFDTFPLLVGTSRKSFLGKILNGAPPDKRLTASLASAAIAAWNGANIVRVHDVRETVEALKVVDAIKGAYNK